MNITCACGAFVWRITDEFARDTEGALRHLEGTYDGWTHRIAPRMCVKDTRRVIIDEPQLEQCPNGLAMGAPHVFDPLSDGVTCATCTPIWSPTAFVKTDEPTDAGPVIIIDDAIKTNEEAQAIAQRLIENYQYPRDLAEEFQFSQQVIDRLRQPTDDVPPGSEPAITWSHDEFLADARPLDAIDTSAPGITPRPKIDIVPPPTAETLREAVAAGHWGYVSVERDTSPLSQLALAIDELTERVDALEARLDD